MNHDQFEYVMCKVASTHQGYLATISNYCDANFFDNPDTNAWIGATFSFFKKYDKIPTMTELRVESDSETIQLLESCQRRFSDIDTNLDPAALIQNTERFLREKGLHRALVDVTTQMAKDRGELKTLSLEDITARFSNICNIRLANDSGWNFFKKLEDLGKELVKPNRTISTGLPWLDKKMGGGWDADGKVLYAFAGQPNIGKSIFLGHVAKAGVQQGKKVLLISLEMSEVKYAKRIAASMSQVSMNSMSQHIPEMISRAAEYGAKTGGELVIKEFPTHAVSVGQVGAWIQELIRQGFKPDMIVIDYLNLLLSGKTTSGKYEEILEVAEQLRGLSYKFRCPIITATQLNRDGYGRENPGMETTSESSGLCATVDGQFSIFQSDADRELGIIRLGIQKMRDGEKGGVDIIHVDYPTMTLSEAGNDMEDDTPAPIRGIQSAANKFFG